MRRHDRHGGPAFAAHPAGVSRHAFAPATTPHAATTVGSAPNGPNRVGAHASAPHVGNAANGVHANGVHANGGSTVGAGPASPNLAGGLRTSRQSAAQSRILRNTTLSSLAPRAPAAHSLARSTFRGRWAQSGWTHDFRRDHRHHHFGIVLGFVGGLFWPYAYDDFIDYTFWPSAYDTFWPYAYDDVFEGLYGGYAPEYDAEYAYAGAPASPRIYADIGAPGAAAQICSGQAQGLTDFPIERIAQQVRPDQSQQALLDDLKAATDKAVQILQAACPSDLPATPTGRLAAMRIRVTAMLQAVQTVRPALDKFYQSLSDEQKERFNALDENETAGNASANGAQGSSAREAQDLSRLCNSRKSPVAGLPLASIRESLRLSDAQNANLQALDQASAKAAQILTAGCPTAPTLTPPGRIAAMEQRLQAMVQAIETVRPALATFYGSLRDEQKARFDRLGARPT